MMTKRLFNMTRNQSLLDRLIVAESPSERFLGLIPYRSLEDDQGMWLPRCSSIHTFFMSFPIDCYFLNGTNRVVRIQKNVLPYRMAIGNPISTRSVLEIDSRRASPLEVEIEDRLELQDAPKTLSEINPEAEEKG
jgi:hypothetical protein